MRRLTRFNQKPVHVIDNEVEEVIKELFGK
jgi:hypothetical protein